MVFFFFFNEYRDRLFKKKKKSLGHLGYWAQDMLDMQLCKNVPAKCRIDQNVRPHGVLSCNSRVCDLSFLSARLPLLPCAS